jgi:hypothetical protein
MARVNPTTTTAIKHKAPHATCPYPGASLYLHLHLRPAPCAMAASARQQAGRQVCTCSMGSQRHTVSGQWAVEMVMKLHQRQRPKTKAKAAELRNRWAARSHMDGVLAYAVGGLMCWSPPSPSRRCRKSQYPQSHSQLAAPLLQRSTAVISCSSAGLA